MSSSADSKLHTLRNGAFSALVACTALQPLDVLKTRLQQPQQPQQQQQQQSVGKRLSVFSLSTSIIRKEGVLALWKGLTPTLLRNVPGSAVYFLLLQQSKKYSSGSNFDNLLVGSFSRVVAGTLVMPLTVIKTQYESTLYQHHSILEAFRTILRNNGFRGLFAGFYATVLRDAPYAGIYISLYEHLKQKLERVRITKSKECNNNSSYLKYFKKSLELIESERVVEYEYMQQQQQQVRFVVLKGIEDDVIIIIHTTKDSTNYNQFECTKCTTTTATTTTTSNCYHLKLLKCIKEMESYGIIGEDGIKRVKLTMNEYLELLLLSV
ncbi:hypothetical protein MP638_006730 [Amoeboaphelidium occidentale]|nr:hypothetical protein MP638_006730 [Amoeboaphelidium occidentale]